MFEAKTKIVSINEIEKQLIIKDAKFFGEEILEDVYYFVGDREFKIGKDGLTIEIVNNPKTNFFSFKKVNVDISQVKPTQPVIKHRRLFNFMSGIAATDEVDSLGTFLELQAGTEDRVKEMMLAMDIKKSQLLTKSYARLKWS